VPQGTHILETSGNGCVFPITSQALCEVAAYGLGLAYAAYIVVNGTESHQPPACYHNPGGDGHLFFNTYSASSGTCTDGQPCVCNQPSPWPPGLVPAPAPPSPLMPPSTRYLGMYGNGCASPITSKHECEAAATGLGLAYQQAVETSGTESWQPRRLRRDRTRNGDQTRNAAKSVGY
jgi:hypothetical protein